MIIILVYKLLAIVCQPSDSALDADKVCTGCDCVLQLNDTMVWPRALSFNKCCWCSIVIGAVLPLAGVVVAAIALVLTYQGQGLMHLTGEAGRTKYTAGDSALFSLTQPAVPLLYMCSYDAVAVMHNSSLSGTLYLLREAPPLCNSLSDNLTAKLDVETLSVPPEGDGFLFWSFYLHACSTVKVWMCGPHSNTSQSISFHAIKGASNFTEWKHDFSPSRVFDDIPVPDCEGIISSELEWVAYISLEDQYYFVFKNTASVPVEVNIHWLRVEAKEYAPDENLVIVQCDTEGNMAAQTCTVPIPYTRNQSNLEGLRVLVTIDVATETDLDTLNRTIAVDVHCKCTLQVLPFTLVVTSVLALVLCFPLSVFLCCCIRRLTTQRKPGYTVTPDPSPGIPCDTCKDSGSHTGQGTGYCSDDGCPGMASTDFSGSDTHTSVETHLSVEYRRVRNYNSISRSSSAASVASVSVVIRSGGETSHVNVRSETIPFIAEQNTAPIVVSNDNTDTFSRKL